MRKRRPVGRRALEQEVAQQIERRTAQQHRSRLAVGVAIGMREHQLVADRGNDDARHQRQMHVGVGETRQPARIARAAMRRLAVSAPILK